jgi:hypothetical protein
MKIKKTPQEMFPVFRKVLDAKDYKAISKKTAYSANTVRLVLTGIAPITERNKVIIDEAIKLTNKHLQNSLKIMNDGKE